MKKLFTIILLFSCLFSHAQTDKDTIYDVTEYPLRGHVQLTNNEKINLKAISLTGDKVMLIQSFFPATQSYTANIADIKMIKVKRQSFLKGAVSGAAVGFLLGYALGYASYNERTYRTDEENNDHRKNRGIGFGLLGALPTGAIGGAFSTIVIKTRFPINGSKERLTKVIRKTS